MIMAPTATRSAVTTLSVLVAVSTMIRPKSVSEILSIGSSSRLDVLSDDPGMCAICVPS